MPKFDEISFALKTFLAALAALYLAFWLGLDNPFWARAAYIVAHPLTGAMRSKAVYRFVGTLVGDTAAVVLVPNLANAPLLLSLALSCWIGLCLFISLLDRTPRAYIFMLAGYTAGNIGFPSVDTPQLIFQTALARVEEISLGIFCTTVVGTVEFPRAIGPVLARRIATWMKPTIDWATAAGYFEETKLQQIHIGETARVMVMDGSPAIIGHVQGLAAGITDGQRAASPTLLADVNPTFTWVRLAQRVPVRIALDHVPPTTRLVAGMTCTVVIGKANPAER
jgi:uncharacterized membrane protein YccC